MISRTILLALLSGSVLAARSFSGNDEESQTTAGTATTLTGASTSLPAPAASSSEALLGFAVFDDTKCGEEKKPEGDFPKMLLFPEGKTGAPTTTSGGTTFSTRSEKARKSPSSAEKLKARATGGSDSVVATSSPVVSEASSTTRPQAPSGASKKLMARAPKKKPRKTITESHSELNGGHTTTSATRVTTGGTHTTTSPHSPSGGHGASESDSTGTGGALTTSGPASESSSGGPTKPSSTAGSQDSETCRTVPKGSGSIKPFVNEKDLKEALANFYVLEYTEEGCEGDETPVASKDMKNCFKLGDETVAVGIKAKDYR